MGSPRRFYGSGEPIHIDDVIIPARCAVEVTFRTHQQRFLMRPDEEANEILLGCFGRAYHRYPELRLNVLSLLSNHGCMVCMPESPYILSRFMQGFLSDAAKKLNLQRGRDGTFWERRYRAIPILDEKAMDERFEYVLTQGTKENLVWSVREWPGISSTKALLGGPGLVGRWRDRTAEGELKRQRARKIERAAKRGRTLELPEAPQVVREYPIELVPMPHWQHLKVGQRRARVAEMISRDDTKTRERHEQDGTQPLGVEGILETDPFDRPADPAKSPAPLCHTTSKPMRKAYRGLYNAFLDVLADRREVARANLTRLELPWNATLPPLCHAPSLPPRPKQPPAVVIDANGEVRPLVGPAWARDIGPPVRSQDD